MLDEALFERKDLFKEDLIPVANQQSAAREGWTLGGRSRIPVPYLSYDPDTFLGTVVDRIIGERDTALDICYMDALAEAIKRRTVLGGGVAWLPELSISEELVNGTLVRMGGATWTAHLTVSMFCSPDRLDETGLALWNQL
jgi:DNA-binding transcriptional LysR family regulator